MDLTDLLSVLSESHLSVLLVSLPLPAPGRGRGSSSFFFLLRLLFHLTSRWLNPKFNVRGYRETNNPPLARFVVFVRFYELLR